MITNASGFERSRNGEPTAYTTPKRTSATTKRIVFFFSKSSLDPG
jgi:hypothetical protein